MGQRDYELLGKAYMEYLAGNTLTRQQAEQIYNERSAGYKLEGAELSEQRFQSLYDRDKAIGYDPVMETLDGKFIVDDYGLSVGAFNTYDNTMTGGWAEDLIKGGFGAGRFGVESKGLDFGVQGGLSSSYDSLIATANPTKNVAAFAKENADVYAQLEQVRFALDEARKKNAGGYFRPVAEALQNQILQSAKLSMVSKYVGEQSGKQVDAAQKQAAEMLANSQKQVDAILAQIQAEQLALSKSIEAGNAEAQLALETSIRDAEARKNALAEQQRQNEAALAAQQGEQAKALKEQAEAAAKAADEQSKLAALGQLTQSSLQASARAAADAARDQAFVANDVQVETAAQAEGPTYLAGRKGARRAFFNTTAGLRL